VCSLSLKTKQKKKKKKEEETKKNIYRRHYYEPDIGILHGFINYLKKTHLNSGNVLCTRDTENKSDNISNFMGFLSMARKAS